MRTIGILLLSLTPFLFGLDYRSSLKKQRDLFLNLRDFVIFTKEQIRFCLRERDEIFALSDTCPEFCGDFLLMIKKSVKRGENIAKRIEENSYNRLKTKEKSEIEAFFLGLGKTDAEGQINHCDHYINLFGKKSERLENSYTAKSRISLGLSLSLTAAMFIIMI